MIIEEKAKAYDSLERAKEIDNNAVDYATKHDYPWETGSLAKGFRAGAKWSDEHPRKGLVDINKACEFWEEVDLGEEIYKWQQKHFEGIGYILDGSGGWIGRTTLLDIAKYFFELGIKAQKG